MVGNSFDLVDFIRSQLSDTFISRLAMHLGDARDKVQSAIHASVPGFLSEFDSAASSPDGARRLASAIDDSDDTVLDNFSQAFRSDYPADAQMGILRSIMGAGGLSSFAGSLGRISGLSGKSVTTILAVLGPMILGGIKRALLTRGLRPADIASFLSSERTHINSALPAGMSHMVSEEYSSPRTTSRVRHVETETETERSNSWVLPLLGLLAAIGLIWYLASRATRPVMREASNVTEPAPVPAADLKDKYRTVIQEAESQGVEFSSIQQENGKLVLKGTAPTMDAVDRVRDEIRRVNPQQDEIVADLSVESSHALMPTTPSTETVPDKVASMPGESEMTREKPGATVESEEYTVVRGDTLSSISKHFYGNSRDYHRIFDANKDRLSNPNALAVGDRLVIPKE
ncbi:MAG TPA: DUF937 domain-containing protein [Terriglobia bacterium]|nr:DUF937 domain-containing protein [Terriglobia bacterium]